MNDFDRMLYKYLEHFTHESQNNHQEPEELIDSWDFEPILIGTPIVTIDGECMKRENFIDYLEDKYPEIFSVYKG